MPDDGREFPSDRERAIAERLSRVCAHLGDGEFRALVRDVAEMQRRFALIDAGERPAVGASHREFR